MSTVANQFMYKERTIREQYWQSNTMYHTQDQREQARHAYLAASAAFQHEFATELATTYAAQLHPNVQERLFQASFASNQSLHHVERRYEELAIIAHLAAQTGLTSKS